MSDDDSREKQRRRSRWDDGDADGDKSDDARGERDARAAAGTSGRPREDRFDHRRRDDDDRRRRHSRSRSRSPRRERRRSRSRSPRGRDDRDRYSSRSWRDERGRERRRDERGDDDRRRREEARGDADGDDRRRREREEGRSDSRKGSRWAAVDAAADAADAARERDRPFVSGAEGGSDVEEKPRPPPPLQPQFGLSGALAAETNTTADGVTLLHAPPADAAPAPGGGGNVSGRLWRLYVFKGGKELEGCPPIPLRGPTRSTFLFGRDRRVADVPTDHGSCSKQHAVIQFRRTNSGSSLSAPASRPYLMDLGSTNGTFLNGERVESLRYYELLPKDVFRFGESTREFVVLPEDVV